MMLHCFKSCFFVIFMLYTALLVGCSLPSNQAMQQSTIQPHVEEWYTDPETQANIAQGFTGYLTLDNAFNSIAARLYLIHHAQHSLDVQYYIWADDNIGHMMFNALLNAADRGVKIRLLIDDQNGVTLDHTLQALAQHPNFEIKLFNPYKYRHVRILDYGLRLRQINHRMHNKLLIADGAVAITGGRNISQEYFDASDDYQFTDLDILFLGTALPAANQSFQAFWQHPLSYETQQIIRPAEPQALKELRQRYASKQPSQDQLNKQLKQAEQAVQEDLQRRQHVWAKAKFVADPPDKILRRAPKSSLLYQQLQTQMGTAHRQMNLVSAYFVPTEKGVNTLIQLVNDGAKVRVLTNSYLANDVPIVHAFYQKYRKALLEKGIQLYEFKPYIERPKRTWYEVMTGNIIPAKSKNASRLHAKFFSIDQKVYIGSFNFDPRSAQLNTEVGIVLDSAALQQDIQQSLDENLMQVAYQLKLDAAGEIIWIEQLPNGEKLIHQVEPETTKFQRFMFKAIAFTPFEWMM